MEQKIYKPACPLGLMSRAYFYKSKGEHYIAEFLKARNIAFGYEYPLAIRDRGHTRIWYPDFRLPEFGMILEYFGVNGNSAYTAQIEHKLQTYQAEGIDGIYLTESSFSDNWQGQILKGIERSLEGKLRQIRSVNSAAGDAAAGRRGGYLQADFGEHSR